MLGAIIGDIVGSRFEFNNHRSKDFDLFEVFGFDYEDNEEEVEASEIDEL